MAGSLGLAALLLGATLYTEELYALLEAGWFRCVTGLGLAAHLPAVLRPNGPLLQFTYRARSVPAVGLYGLLYLGLCLGLLLLLLPTRRSRQLALRLYGGMGLAIGLLLLGSRLGGGPALSGLATHLVQFVMSPLPVMVLVPLLRWPVSPVSA